MSVKHKVISIKRGGINETANIYYSRGDEWSFKIIFNDETEYEITGSDVFSCFCKIRNHFLDIVFMCKGAKRNVYPSSMSRDMSGGVAAYELHGGKHSKREDLVNIFDFENEDIVSPLDQKDYFLSWAQSERR